MLIRCPTCKAKREAKLKSSAKEYVENALAQAEGRKPSQAQVKKAVDQVVKAFAPVVLKLKAKER